MSMYKKRKDKQWLDQAFGKTKNIEGFSSSVPTCPTNPDHSICTRLKYLLCDTNFNKCIKLFDEILVDDNKINLLRRILNEVLVEEPGIDKLNILKKYIDADWVNKSGNYYRLNTKGANVYTFGGDITTSKYDGGVGHNDNDSPIRSNEFETRPVQSEDIGGDIRTGGGSIRTYSGTISTKKFIPSSDSWTNSGAGDIFAGDATMSIQTILPTSSKLKTKESGSKKFVSTHGSW